MLLLQKLTHFLDMAVNNHPLWYPTLVKNTRPTDIQTGKEQTAGNNICKHCNVIKKMHTVHELYLIVAGTTLVSSLNRSSLNILEKSRPTFCEWKPWTVCNNCHIMSPFVILVITIRNFIQQKNNLEKVYIKIINLNVVPGFLRNQTDKMFISLVAKEAQCTIQNVWDDLLRKLDYLITLLKTNS